MDANGLHYPSGQGINLYNRRFVPIFLLKSVYYKGSHAVQIEAHDLDTPYVMQCFTHTQFILATINCGWNIIYLKGCAQQESSISCSVTFLHSLHFLDYFHVLFAFLPHPLFAMASPAQVNFIFGAAASVEPARSWTLDNELILCDSCDFFLSTPFTATSNTATLTDENIFEMASAHARSDGPKNLIICKWERVKSWFKCGV